MGQPTAWKASASPYITQAVVEELTQRFGEELVRKGGMRVQTTVDLNMQRRAEETVQKAFQQARSRGLRADQIAVAAVDRAPILSRFWWGAETTKKANLTERSSLNVSQDQPLNLLFTTLPLRVATIHPFSTIDDSPVSYPDGNGTYSPQNYGDLFLAP